MGSANHSHTAPLSCLDADVDGDDNHDEAAEAEDTFPDDDFDSKVASVRTPDRRRTSVSTKMLACVEAEAALDQALMAADLALARLKKENSPVDFSVEIAELETAITRAETVFGHKETSIAFFSADHITAVHQTIDHARNKLTELSDGPTKTQSAKPLIPMEADSTPEMISMSAPTTIPSSPTSLPRQFPEFEDGLSFSHVLIAVCCIIILSL